MVMKKSSRGAITRAFSRRRRYKEDEEYREKTLEQQRQYRKNHYKRHHEEELARSRNWTKQLNEFTNKKCKVCNKLLHYKTKSRFCRNHHPKWKKKKKSKQDC